MLNLFISDMCHIAGDLQQMLFVSCSDATLSMFKCPVQVDEDCVKNEFSFLLRHPNDDAANHNQEQADLYNAITSFDQKMEMMF